MPTLPPDQPEADLRKNEENMNLQWRSAGNGGNNVLKVSFERMFNIVYTCKLFTFFISFMILEIFSLSLNCPPSWIT
jgi:hypothetical protein